MRVPKFHKRIEELRGFGKLNDQQKKALIHGEDNIIPLPGRYNSSKGSKADDDIWERFKKEDLDPDYKDWLNDAQQSQKRGFRKKLMITLVD